MMQCCFLILFLVLLNFLGAFLVLLIANKLVQYLYLLFNVSRLVQKSHVVILLCATSFLGTSAQDVHAIGRRRK